MARISVLDLPSGCEDDITSPGPDASNLVRARVGFRDDKMWRTWDWIFGLWANKLRDAGVASVFWRSGDEGSRCERGYAALLNLIDAAVDGLANCGCLDDARRGAVPAAHAGLSTTAIATMNFETFVHQIAARIRRSRLPEPVPPSVRRRPIRPSGIEG